MRSARPSNKPTPAPVPLPPTQSARRPRWVWGAGAGVLVALAAGGWYYARERERAAERVVALAAAHDQRPDAGERLTACLARDPNDTELLETLVVWSLRGGVPFAHVEPHLDKLCELQPTNPAPWRTRASQRIRHGRVAEGIADGLRALELDPSDHATRKVVATVAAESGDHALAAREFTRLLDSSPLPPDEIPGALVKVHLSAGDVARAEQVLDRCFPAARPGAEGRFLRGLVHQAAGRHAEAIAELRASADQSALEHRPRSLFALAKSLTAAGRDDDARKALDELDAVQSRERAILDARQRPDDLAAQVRAAEAHLADGKPKEAAELLERATARLGRTPGATAVLARAYRQLGREDLAKRLEQAGR